MLSLVACFIPCTQALDGGLKSKQQQQEGKAGRTCGSQVPSSSGRRLPEMDFESVQT